MMLRRFAALLAIAILLSILVTLVWAVRVHRNETSGASDDEMRPVSSSVIGPTTVRGGEAT